jgi:hypothetical protein
MTIKKPTRKPAPGVKPNPSDNQGARFNLAAVEAGKTWEAMERAE